MLKRWPTLGDDAAPGARVFGMAVALVAERRERARYRTVVEDVPKRRRLVRRELILI